jgi:hypothetical protein
MVLLELVALVAGYFTALGVLTQIKKKFISLTWQWLQAFLMNRLIGNCSNLQSDIDHYRGRSQGKFCLIIILNK